RMSCGSPVATGVGVGGLYLGMPSARAAAIPGETVLVTPSESVAGWGVLSPCLGVNMGLEASPAAGLAAALAWAGAGGGCTVSWAAAGAAAARRARSVLQVLFNMAPKRGEKRSPRFGSAQSNPWRRAVGRPALGGMRARSGLTPGPGPFP